VAGRLFFSIRIGLFEHPGVDLFLHTDLTRALGHTYGGTNGIAIAIAIAISRAMPSAITYH